MIHGSKALNAEIMIDFKKNHVKMDYSINPKGVFTPFSDSNKITFWSEPKTIKFVVRDFFSPFFGFALLTFDVFINICISFAIFFKIDRKIFDVYRLDILHQNLLKKICENRWGTYEQSVIGKQRDKIVSFHIPHNLYFHYELYGDYEKYIQKISLLRFFVRRKHFGINSTKQWGWNVIFEFDKPPEYGHCAVRYV